MYLVLDFLSLLYPFLKLLCLCRLMSSLLECFFLGHDASWAGPLTGKNEVYFQVQGPARRVQQVDAPSALNNRTPRSSASRTEIPRPSPAIPQPPHAHDGFSRPKKRQHTLSTPRGCQKRRQEKSIASTRRFPNWSHAPCNRRFPN